MGKLQAKYKIAVDRDLTFKKAKAQGLSTRESGGRPTKGVEDPGGQLIIALKKGTKAVFSPKVVQVYWSNDENISEIEKSLNELVVFDVNEIKRFCSSTREEVPTIDLYRKEAAEAKADRTRVLNIYKEWRSQIENALRIAAKIRNGRICDFICCNRRAYVGRAQEISEELENLSAESVRNGWDCDDLVRLEIARLKRIVDSGGRF